MLRSPNIRFFNNVAVVIKTQEEIIGESEESDSILERKIHKFSSRIIDGHYGVLPNRLGEHGQNGHSIHGGWGLTTAQKSNSDVRSAEGMIWSCIQFQRLKLKLVHIHH